MIPLEVDPRYIGPDDTAHGGYLCGRLARLAALPADRLAVVTLLEPVPVGTPLDFRPAAVRSGLWEADRLLASVAGKPAASAIPPIDPVSLDVARQSSEGFLGRIGHPFPRCFACGPERTDDGLRLAPGLAGPGLAACAWTPPGDAGAAVEAELIWAALDCPSGWTADPRERPGVLSRMTAELLAPVLAGQPHVIVARREADRGRTATNTSAIYTAAGTLLARAATLWTVIDAS